MKKYRPYRDFPAHGKTMEALAKMLWWMSSDISDHFAFVPIVVFEAFAIESYVNTLGAEYIDIWDELERLPWRKKISILHRTAKKTPDWEKEPLQFATEVFRVRDRLAHGKPERIEGRLFDSHQEAMNTLGTREMEPEWFTRIDKQWVLDSRERLDSLMKYLGSLLDHPSLDYQCGGFGGVTEVEVA